MLTFSAQTLARRLAYIGSVNDDILEMDEIVLCLLEELGGKYPAALEERYGITGERPSKCSNRYAKRGELCSAAGNSITNAANAPSSTISARAGSAGSASTVRKT